MGRLTAKAGTASTKKAKKAAAKKPAKLTGGKGTAAAKKGKPKNSARVSQSSAPTTLTKTGAVPRKTSRGISRSGEPLRERSDAGKSPKASAERSNRTLKLARQAAKAGLDRKGHDVRILDLRNLSSVCDYFVILSGDADVHVRAIADAIEESLTGLGHRPTYREGKREGTWIVLDYIDVVVHIFMDGTRRFYQLEKLWGDAPAEVVTDD